MHNIYKTVYPENVNKAEVQAEWDETAAREDWGEGSAGLYSCIRWIDTVCETKAEAEAYIKAHDYSYAQLAVKFKEPAAPVKSAKLDELSAKYTEVEKEYRARLNKVHYEGVKSAYISCQCCGSRINSQYFGRTVKNACPVCGKDLRPASTMEAIERLGVKLNALRDKYQAEYNKLAAKAKQKICWLVKIEYHT